MKRFLSVRSTWVAAEAVFDAVRAQRGVNGVCVRVAAVGSEPKETHAVSSHCAARRCRDDRRTSAGDRSKQWNGWQCGSQSTLTGRVLFAGAFTATVANLASPRRTAHCDAVKGEWVSVGKAADFKDGDVREIKVREGKDAVLVSRVDGKLHCTGAACTHFGAPLEKGVSTKTHVTCPLHDAEFDIKTGLCINGPGLNAIPVYEWKEQPDGRLSVFLPLHIQSSVVPPMSSRDPKDNRSFVIIGGGPAALTAAETLRQQGFTGKLTILTKETVPPYDRTVLSKNLGVPIDKLCLRDEQFIKDKISAEFRKGEDVVNVDKGTKEVVLKGGGRIKYDKLLLAPGCRPRVLTIAGAEAQNIFTLRTPQDSQKIAKFAQQGMRVVVVGSSVLGIEVAAALAKKEATVSLIGSTKFPMENILGEKVGRVFAKLLTENGVKLFPQAKVTAFRQSSAKCVEGVQLQGGEVLQADAVVVCVGAEPNTEFARAAGFNTDTRNAILVDPLMKTSVEDVYAAGDATTFPYFMSGDEIHVEHWDVAMQQGRVAARNMLSDFVPFKTIPFFSTMVFGKSLRYAGFCSKYDEVICEGNLEKYTFVAYYVKDNKICAVATMGKDPVAVGVCEAFKLNLMPSVQALRLGAENADTILKRLKQFSK